jgi:hypothetical protein
MSGHGGFNLRVRNRGFTGNQVRRLHDLAGLAEPALRHFKFAPRELNRMGALRMQPFDGDDFRAFERPHGNLTSTRRGATHVYRAGTTLGDATAEFGAGQIQQITQVP